MIGVQRMLDEERVVEVSLVVADCWQIKFQSVYKAFQFMQQFYSSLSAPPELNIYVQTFNMARDP